MNSGPHACAVGALTAEPLHLPLSIESLVAQVWHFTGKNVRSWLILVGALKWKLGDLGSSS
jgi:hypothetical protein